MSYQQVLAEVLTENNEHVVADEHLLGLAMSPEAHELSAAFLEGLHHFETLTSLYREMAEVQSRGDVSLEVANHYRARADLALNAACCDASFPTLEDLGSVETEWAVTMEGIADASRKVLSTVGDALAGTGKALLDTLDFITINAGRTLKRIDDVRTKVEAKGDGLKESKITIKVRRALLQSDGQRRYPTADDVGHYAEHIAKWSNLEVLQRAISENIQTLRAEDKRETRKARVQATQEAIVDHYGLVIDKKKDTKLPGKLLGIFRKEPVASQVTLMGGLRVEGIAGFGDKDSDFGRVYVSDLSAVFGLSGVRYPEGPLPAPTKKEMLATLDALSDMMRDTKAIRQNISDAKKSLDVYKKEIKQLSKLSVVDWTRLIVGNYIAGQVGAPVLAHANVAFNIVKRYTNTIAQLSGALSRDTISMTHRVLEATEIAASNLE